MLGFILGVIVGSLVTFGIFMLFSAARLSNNSKNDEDEE